MLFDIQSPVTQCLCVCDECRVMRCILWDASMGQWRHTLAVNRETLTTIEIDIHLMFSIRYIDIVFKQIILDDSASANRIANILYIYGIDRRITNIFLRAVHINHFWISELNDGRNDKNRIFCFRCNKC